ncbi:MAG: hypothetical protein ABI432_10435 [Flavobacteriales bacterium]
MTRYIRPLLVLILLSALAPSCKKENKIPVITVSPAGPDIDVVSGDVISFSIQAVTDNSTLSRVVITSKKGNSFTVTLEDSTITGTAFNWNWEYLVANATEAYSEILIFKLYDSNGGAMETKRTLYVTLGATLLTETSGHTFYSGNSAIHPESAFDLEERIPVLSTVDSSRRDIQDNPVDGVTTELSRNWISPANGRLVRFNGYDYANATDISLRSAFETGIPVEEMPGIAVGDIILTKLGSLDPNTGFYAALRIVDIVDVVGTADNDRYIFNMKYAVFVE